VLNALKWDAAIPAGKVDVTVSQGWVTLKGEVDHGFQKRDALRAICRLSGTKGITNLMMVKPPQPAPQDLKSQIEKALVRNAQTDATYITVEVQGSEVILRGAVSSYAEKKAAEETASSASGVTEVDNRIIVSLPV
jgi:osmotically-inducible protein OsmY